MSLAEWGRKEIEMAENETPRRCATPTRQTNILGARWQDLWRVERPRTFGRQWMKYLINNYLSEFLNIFKK